MSLLGQIASGVYAAAIKPFKGSEKRAADYGGKRVSTNSKLHRATTIDLAAPSRTSFSLDNTNMIGLTPNQIIDRLTNAHPDVSYTIWNALRLGCTPINVTVENLKGGEFAAGQKVIDDFIMRLTLPSTKGFGKSRSLDKIANQMMRTSLTRGAVSAELVLGTGGIPEFIAVVDPATVTFRITEGRYTPSQENRAIDLDIPTFFFEGLDEDTESPYGNNPLMAAINIIVFQLELLNDIKAVVHKHGYPKDDIILKEEALLKRIPPQYARDDNKKREWLNARLSDVKDMYDSLFVDEAFVHTDSVEVVQGTSSGGGGAILDPEKLMQTVDSLIMSGLKTLTTILGRRTNGSNEAFAKLEIKLYMQTVKAHQKLVSSVLSSMLTLALNMTGKQGIVKVKFNDIDIRTDLEREQFETLRYSNIAYKRDQGWIDNDTAAKEAGYIRAVGDPVRSSDVRTDGTKNNSDGTQTKPSTRDGSSNSNTSSANKDQSV